MTNLEDRYFNEIVEYEKIVRDYQKQVDDLMNENERLRLIKECLKRQVKERANVEKDNHPKKEHTGYMLVLSNPIDYRYMLHGNRKRITLFQTILQSPYNLDYSYYEATEIIFDDLFKNWDKDDNMLRLFGAEHVQSNKKYEELVDEEIKNLQNEWINEQVNEYKKEHGWEPYWDEKCKIIDASKEIEVHIYFDFNIRANGKDGRWEVMFSHTEPLIQIPRNMRFKKATNKEEK